MGGLGVILGFCVGVGVIVVFAIDEVPGAFYYASVIAVLGAGLVGLMDDIFGLRQRMKALLPFLMALPLGAVVEASGDTVVLGVNLGLFTMIAVPLGVTAGANACNMLEGFNGLGAGMGIVMCVALVALSFLTGDTQGMYLIFPLLGALLAFLWFNKFPARVFPGDSMTLFTGATIAAAAIITHQKTYGALLFLPMIAEFLLKVRGRFQAENYGEPDNLGRLHYGGRTESIAHFVMKKHPMTEPHLVYTLWGLEGIVATAIVLLAVIQP